MRRLLLGALIVLGCDGVDGVLVRTPTDAAGGEAGASSAGGSAAFSPAPGVRWQAQLQGELDSTLDVDFFYLDPDNLADGELPALRAAGRRVGCYFSAGSFEPWRDDADQFPGAVLGNELAGYPDERWLDVRDETVRAIMAARVERLAALACDALLPANLEAYESDSGFALTRDDELDYARFLADAIHAQGLSAGLSAGDELIGDAMAEFDWGLGIDCLADGECAGYQALRASGKAMLLIEFGDESDAPAVCASAERLGFDALIKQPGLGAFRIGCSD
jgi:hypothetical protein